MKYGLLLINSPILLLALCIFVVYIGIAAVFRLMGKLELAKYIAGVAISFDQTANAILFGNMDQTMSGRMGRRIRLGKATKAEKCLCKLLTWIDPDDKGDHCGNAEERDEKSIKYKL